MSGTNGETSGYSGVLRLIFSAVQENSSTEVFVFSADYTIDSVLTYQQQRITVVDSTEETVVIPVGEAETISGFITFRTLDTTDEIVTTFLDLVAPPSDTTDANADGLFDNPAVYEIVDSVAGGEAVTDDFSTVTISHGTGRLTDSAWNAIPQLDSDIQSWVNAFNYPFCADANLTSVDNIVIPTGLFREFDITAPAGDEPDGDTSGLFFPVWISRIERIGTGSNQLRFFFATHNVTDSAPSTTAEEFAALDILRTGDPGDIIEITPTNDLFLVASGDTLFHQHFGRGHVVLSNLWSGTTSTVDDFFDAFDLILDDPPDTSYTQTSTRISSFGISRVPKYAPTIGESQALKGSTATLSSPVHPSSDNRYVTEGDQGLGDRIDLESQSGITPHTAIERYGQTGALAHRVVSLIVDATELGTSATFYEDEILPRMRFLFGRDPAFGDFWWDGTRLKFFNGDTWVG